MKFRSLVLVAVGCVFCLGMAGTVSCKKAPTAEENSSPSSDDKQPAAEEQSEDREGDSPESARASENKDNDGGADKKAEANPEGQKSGQAGKPSPLAKDAYPGMNLASLSEEQRRTVRELTESELCPCEDATESLHSCLKVEKKQCPLALRVGALIGMSLKRGLSKTDIMSRIADYVEAARKEYSFDLEDSPSKGAEDAPVTIVEFADFECPHCKKASDIVGQLVSKHSDKVQYYFKHLPFKSHKHAKYAAKASMAAHLQGRFWPMHDLLFEHQSTLSRDKINRLAKRVGLNFSKFKKDIRGRKVARMVESDIQEAKEAKVTKTPTIFINGKRFLAGLDKKALEKAILRTKKRLENND